jgi:hypothetical protein
VPVTVILTQLSGELVIVLEAAVVVVGAKVNSPDVVGRGCGKMKCEKSSFEVNLGSLVAAASDVAAASVVEGADTTLVSRVVGMEPFGRPQPHCVWLVCLLLSRVD